MSAIDAMILAPEKRVHERVNFTRQVILFGSQHSQTRCSIKNLSLGGAFIVGSSDIPAGEDCCMELRENGHNSSLPLTFSGKILRRYNNGLAVEFTGMESDSFMYLQTYLLYSSDDPLAIAEEFTEEFTPRSSATC